MEKTLKKIHARLQGGHVLRYHTKPEMGNQDVASHSWRAVVILETLWPDATKNCLLALLFHDVGESHVGDVPATTKWGYPEVGKIIETIETNYKEKYLEINYETFLTENEKNICKMADTLELILFSYRQMQQGNQLAVEIFSNGVNHLNKNYSHLAYFSPVKKVLDDLPIIKT